MNIDEFIEEKAELVEVKEGSLILAKQMQEQLIELETQRKELDKKSKEIKEKIKEVMKNNGITKYESNDKRLMISLGDDTTTYDIDKDMLWEKYPDIYRECNVKETQRAGQLRITTRTGE